MARVRGARGGRVGTLAIRIGGRYPLADAAQAHRDLEGGGTTGKLLVVP